MKNTLRNRIATIAVTATMAFSMAPAMSVSASAFDTADTQTSVTAEVSQQYEMQPGDVFVTNCAMFDGLVGHAAIAISHDKILHIGGMGEHPSVMSLAEWNEHYSSESGTWTKVYRISNPAKAAVAANWAERTYVGSKAEYSITLNKASTDCTYCSKLVWQAFFYGANRHPGEYMRVGYVLPYELEDEIPDMHLVHTFRADR